MKTKAANIFSSIKYEFCVFVLLGVQALANLSPYFRVGEFTRLYYLIDYSMGKTSRLLVGTIVKLFNPDPSPEWIAGFAMAILAVVLLLVSVVIGKVIKVTPAEQKTQLFVFVAFFITGIFTFSGFSIFLGLLDIWMFLAALLAVVCANNKYLRWFVPVLCAAGVLVHNAFAITYFPLVILAVLYFAATGEKKGANIIVFVLSCLVTLAITVFVTLKGAETATLTYEQLQSALKNRGGYTYDDYGINYIAFYLLDIPPEYTGYTSEMVAQASLFERFVMMAKQNIRGVALGHTLAVTVFGGVVLAVFWAIWVKCIVKTTSKSKRFVYLCFMLSVFVIPVGMLVASDFIRWFQASIITQFGLAMLMFFAKDEDFAKVTDGIGAFFSDKKLLLAIMFIVYATVQPHGLSA